MSDHNSQMNQSLLTGLAMTGGLGMTIMIVAAGIGVADSAIDSQLIGLFVLIGFLILMTAILAWFFVVQPHRAFDDIDIPAPDDHGHSHPEETHDAAGHAAH